MSEHMKAVVAESELHEATLGKYVSGFVGSIAITLAAYMVATSHGSGSNTVPAIILACFAVIQFVVQMIFFLHVGTERRPRWKLAVMCMMLGVVLILVFGSLWIMDNLNYRMTPQQQEQYLKSQDAL